MKILFYFIHPAKYQAFRGIINKMLSEGIQVDLVIIKKSIMEELVASEGWQYTNIFPEGRRFKGVPVYISAFINLFRTLFRLNRFIKGKKYDLCVTDDLFTVLGRLKGIPTIFFTDDDLSAVPESVLLISTAHYVLAPSIAYMGRYEKKKIGYYGYKSLMHLHPNCFAPQETKLDVSIAAPFSYFLIRCVSVTSTHDVGNNGINDELLRELILFLQEYGKVIISSERPIPADLESYCININKKDISHYIAFCRIFISDSTTMCAEAAVLGIPSIEIDDWFDDFRQYSELNEKYGLLKGINPADRMKIFNELRSILNDKDLDGRQKYKREKMLKNMVDVSAFVYWLLANYPSSVKEYFKNPGTQLRFK